MKRFTGSDVGWIVIALFSFLVAIPNAHAAPVCSPETGSCYERVTAPQIPWADAETAAEALSYQGVSGHLATITSQVENDFITNNLPQEEFGGHWIGGFQPPGSPEPAGNWQWVTGEPFVYTNWRPGEPNNLGEENNLEIDLNPSDPNVGLWVDEGFLFNIWGYVVEYDNTTAAPVCSRETGSCYERVTAPQIPWADAETAAEALSYQGVPGHLATITSQAENDFITNNLSAGGTAGYWIGGFQPPGSPEPAGNWQWVTGEPFVYTNWRPGEPNNVTGSENNLVIDFVTDPSILGLWNDEGFLFNVGGYVVEYDNTAAAPVCSPETGSCYERVTAPQIPWADAETAAEALSYQGVSGHLATITSQVENDFITNNLPQEEFGGHWIGGFQPPGSPEPAGNWQWVTGEPFVYTNWRPGEPNNLGEENNLEIDLNPSDPNVGLWVDEGFLFNIWGYVVEYDNTAGVECASDISTHVRVQASGWHRDSRTGRYVQQLTLTNVSSMASPGPVSLALDHISSTAMLYTPHGITACTTPTSPFVNIPVGADNVLSPDESVGIILEFTNPTNARISYTPRVLAGPHDR